MKRTTLIISSVLLIIIAAVFLFWENEKKPAPAEPISEEIAFINGFYRAYIMQEGDMKLLGDSVLSDNLRNDLSVIAAWEDSTMMVALDADPFLAAQDISTEWADNLSIISDENPNIYHVILHGDTVTLTLARSADGHLRIDNVASRSISVHDVVQMLTFAHKAEKHLRIDNAASRGISVRDVVQMPATSQN